MNKLTLGQILYQPPGNHRNSGCEYEVTKIGRVWAELDGGRRRCTINTLHLDTGGYAPIQLYMSLTAFESEKELNRAWRELGNSVYNKRIPDGVTIELIEHVSALLKVST